MSPYEKNPKVFHRAPPLFNHSMVFNQRKSKTKLVVTSNLSEEDSDLDNYSLSKYLPRFHQHIKLKTNILFSSFSRKYNKWFWSIFSNLKFCLCLIAAFMAAENTEGDFIRSQNRFVFLLLQTWEGTRAATPSTSWEIFSNSVRSIRKT